MRPSGFFKCLNVQPKADGELISKSSLRKLIRVKSTLEVTGCLETVLSNIASCAHKVIRPSNALITN